MGTSVFYVCVDLFLDDIIPDAFQQQAFLQRTKKLIAPNGLLLYNRLALTMEDKEKNNEMGVKVVTIVVNNMVC